MQAGIGKLGARLVVTGYNKLHNNLCLFLQENNDTAKYWFV